MVVALVAVLLCLCGKSGDEIQTGSGADLRRTQPCCEERHDQAHDGADDEHDVTRGSGKPLAYTFPYSSSFARESQRF